MSIKMIPGDLIIVWFPTYKCNLDCPYCAARCMPLIKDGNEQKPEDWIRVFSEVPFNVKLMTMSGRELSCYPHLRDVLKEVSFPLRFETNLKIHPKKWINDKIASQTDNMKCTMHHPIKGKNARDYFSHLRWLHKTYPHIKLQANNTIHQYSGSPNEFDKRAKKIFGEDTNCTYNHGRMTYYLMMRETFPYAGYHKSCKSGYYKVIITPNGTVYRCVGHAYWGINPLGNILSDGWGIVLDDPEPCELSCCQCGINTDIVYDEEVIKGCKKKGYHYLVPRERIYKKFGIYV